jgi:4-amino-4-deoxychorismate lyase
MSNVFLVGPDASLQTPVIELAGVAGIARSLVLRECAKLGIPCAAVALPRERLWEASGVFVTNVRLGIMPVTTLRTRAGHVKHLAVAPVVERLAAHVEGLDA